jgi:hypothetical protein
MAPMILLMLLAGFVVPQLLGGADPSRGTVEYDAYSYVVWPTIGAAVVWPVLFILWAFLTQGGITLPMMGMALVNSEGKPASRFQCAWRAFLVWAPILLLLVSTYWWPIWVTGYPTFLGFTRAWMVCWLFLTLVFGVGIWLVVSYPNRSWHDRLADTYLVPR